MLTVETPPLNRRLPVAGHKGVKRGRKGVGSKGDKNKVAIATRLRRETTMTLKWIAEHLRMGSWNHVSNLLASTDRHKTKKCKK